MCSYGVACCSRALCCTQSRLGTAREASPARGPVLASQAGPVCTRHLMGRPGGPDPTSCAPTAPEPAPAFVLGTCAALTHGCRDPWMYCGIDCSQRAAVSRVVWVLSHSTTKQATLCHDDRHFSVPARQGKKLPPEPAEASQKHNAKAHPLSRFAWEFPAFISRQRTAR